MANKVGFIIELQNRFSREAEKISRATAKATGRFKSLRTEVRKNSIALIRLGRKAKQVGKSLTSIGKSISLRVSAPIAALTAISIRNFDKQVKALEKIKRTVKTTGGAAGLSVKQLTDEAVRLQNKTLFGDERILNDVTAILLTFTGIAGKSFLKTQEAVLDLSTLMEGDLKSAAVQFGKALNDPIANLGALGRTGIQFGDQQKAMIKRFVQTGQLAKAQAIILKAFNTQFGTLAVGLATVGTGPLTQLLNSIGDFTEEIGEAQFKFLSPLILGLHSILL